MTMRSDEPGKPSTSAEKLQIKQVVESPEFKAAVEQTVTEVLKRILTDNIVTKVKSEPPRE